MATDFVKFFHIRIYEVTSRELTKGQQESMGNINIDREQRDRFEQLLTI